MDSLRPLATVWITIVIGHVGHLDTGNGTWGHGVGHGNTGGGS